MTTNATASETFEEYQRVSQRWTPDWAQLTSVLRQLTHTVNADWQNLPSVVKARVQLFVYYPGAFVKAAPLIAFRNLIVGFSAMIAYMRQDPNFLEYIENVQAFRRAVMNAVERQDPEFQALLATSVNNAFQEIQSGTAEVMGSTEEEIREWFSRHRVDTQQIQ